MAAAWVRGVRMDRRLVATAIAVLLAGAVVVIAREASTTVRNWAPLGYILVGYYASGFLFVAPSPAIEAWLTAWDRRLLGDPSARFASWPRALLGYLEFVYLGCFLVVAAGYAVLAANGYAASADRYWTLVAGAELGSFAGLAFVQTRPPWALERKPVLADRAVHDFAARMTEVFTIGVNTFPSGHVAGSLAVAIAVMAVMPWTGLLFFALAASIAVATVAGRYHYVIDAVAGAALTLVIWLVA